MKEDKIYFRFKHDRSALKKDVYDLMNRCYIELGQKPTDEQVKLNSSLLYNDLIHYCGGMTMDEVAFVFHNGIRNAEEGTSCFMNVRQWSVWLNTHRVSEALKRQQKQITAYESYQQHQLDISKTINQSKLKSSDQINKAIK